MEKYEKRIKTLYRVLSKVYDLMDFPDGKANPRKGLADQLPNEQIRVLDVCCGTGNSSIATGKKNSNNTVIGIDLSSDMLEVAKNKSIKNNLNNVSFKEMNAIKMDFSSGSFDVVTISLAFHEMPQEVFKLFLKIDWKQLLGEFGFKYIDTEYYTFTKLVVASKEDSTGK